MAAEAKDWRREGAAAEKGPTSLTKTGMGIWNDSSWEIRELWFREWVDIDKDFLRDAGRKMKESFPASGSRRYCSKRKASRPRLGVDENVWIEEMIDKKMRRKYVVDKLGLNISISGERGVTP